MRKIAALLFICLSSNLFAQKIELLNGGNKYQLKNEASTTDISFRISGIPLGKTTKVTIEGIDEVGCMKNGNDYTFKVVSTNDTKKLEYATSRTIVLDENRQGSFILYFEKQGGGFTGTAKLKFTIEQDSKIIGTVETEIEVLGEKAKVNEPDPVVHEKKDSLEIELLNKNSVQLYTDKECKNKKTEKGTINLHKLNVYKTSDDKYALYLYTASNKIYSVNNVALIEENGIITNFDGIILGNSDGTYIRLSEIASVSVTNNEVELSKKNQKIKIALPAKKEPAAQPKQK